MEHFLVQRVPQCGSQTGLIFVCPLNFVILVFIAEIAVQIMLSPLLMLFNIFSWTVFSLKIYMLCGVNMRFRLWFQTSATQTTLPFPNGFKIRLEPCLNIHSVMDETLPIETSRHCKIWVLFSKSLSSIIAKLPARNKLILSQINYASNCFSKNNSKF